MLDGRDTKWFKKGLELVDPDKPVSCNHNPHFTVKEDTLKMGMRMHANVVVDFPRSRI